MKAQSNLFEVKIDIQGLCTFIQQIIKRADNQQQRINQLNIKMSNIESKVQKQINSRLEATLIEREQIVQITNRSHHFMTLCLNQAELKSEKFVNSITALNLSKHITDFEQFKVATFKAINVHKNDIESNAMKSNKIQSALYTELERYKTNIQNQIQNKDRMIKDRIEDGENNIKQKINSQLDMLRIQIQTKNVELQNMINRKKVQFGQKLDKKEEKQCRLLKINLLNSEVNKSQNAKNEQMKSLLIMENLQNSIKFLKQKSENLDEQITIILRKIQKDKFKFNNLLDTFNKPFDRKNDQKKYQNFHLALKRMAKQMEQNLQNKQQKFIVEKIKVQLEQKLQLLKATLSQKIDKFQYKKGYTFLQQKIKQIILLVADDQTQQNDSAIRRKPMKCLSCDKDLNYLPLKANVFPNSNPYSSFTNKVLRGQSGSKTRIKKLPLEQDESCH